MRKKLKEKVKKYYNIAYEIDVEGSAGRAARYIMAISGKPIGIAIEERKNLAIMSLRTYRGYIDLNETLRKIATKFGGSGGGHEFAAGARIPTVKLKKFLKCLDEEISETKNK